MNDGDRCAKRAQGQHASQGIGGTRTSFGCVRHRARIAWKGRATSAAAARAAPARRKRPRRPPSPRRCKNRYLSHSRSVARCSPESQPERRELAVLLARQQRHRLGRDRLHVQVRERVACANQAEQISAQNQAISSHKAGHSPACRIASTSSSDHVRRARCSRFSVPPTNAPSASNLKRQCCARGE